MPALSAGTAFTVNEIVCTDPPAPARDRDPRHGAGAKTRARKLAKALDEVTEQEVREALVP